MNQISIAKFFKPKKVSDCSSCMQAGKVSTSQNSPISVVEDCFYDDSNNQTFEKCEKRYAVCRLFIVYF